MSDTLASSVPYVDMLPPPYNMCDIVTIYFDSVDSNYENQDGEILDTTTVRTVLYEWFLNKIKPNTKRCVPLEAWIKIR